MYGWRDCRQFAALHPSRVARARTCYVIRCFCFYVFVYVCVCGCERCDLHTRTHDLVKGKCFRVFYPHNNYDYETHVGPQRTKNKIPLQTKFSESAAHEDR